ncbi:MAG: hypothetical protein ACI89T_002572 [Cognaticolwellia sp.]|jgi:hypothetical protein
MFLDGIKPGVKHGSHLCKSLFDLLKKEKSSYEEKLIPDLSYINHRAECVTGIEIESVQYESHNQYSLIYSFEWFVYNGCADMDEQDTIEEQTSFTVEDDGSINIDFIISEVRSTADEL